MKDNKRKEKLIALMIEAKKIEIKNNQKNFFYKIKNFISKPEKKPEKRIKALKENLQKKDAEELEYMILQKEGSLLLLEKRIKEEKDKNKLKELIDELNKIKKNEGKREKIAREIGFQKKEIKKLQEELKKKMKPEKTREKKKEPEKEMLPEKKELVEKKIETKKEGIKKKSKGKKKEKKEKKTERKKKKGKKKKAEIEFTSPEKELKKQKEKQGGSKRKKALEKFHKEFTSGKNTYVNIEGGANIISGKHSKSEEIPKAFSGRSEEQLEFDIQKVRQKIKNLKSAFFHRQISEEDYKKKLFDYQEELNLLEMERQRPRAKLYSEKEAPAVKAIKEKKIAQDPELKTIQEESIEYATKHTPQSKKKVTEALKKFRKEFKSEPYFGKKEAKKSEEPKETGNTKEDIQATGIIRRLAPDADNKKIEKMEKQLAGLMQKNSIDQTEIRRELEFVSEKELMKKFGDILENLEKKYGKKENKILKEKDTAFDEVAVQKKEKKLPEGKLKEILEKKIVTDFDKLYLLVKEKGKINEKEAAKTLNLNSERIKQCYEVLEKNDLIDVEFPVFGGAQIFSKDYVEPKKEKKKKKEESG